MTKRWLVLLFVTLWLVACGGQQTIAPIPAPEPTVVPTTLPTLTTLPAPTPEPFRIIGYVMDGETVVSQIQFDKLTHINYAFLIPNTDGSLSSIANPWKLEQVVEQAHANGVKVLISVGGWGHDSAFEQMASDAEARGRFVNDLAAFVEQYQLDGADIDWEYPGPGPGSAENYAVLMQSLREAMDSQGKLLTAAVVALGANGEGILPVTFEMVDFLNVMAYDGSDTNHSSYQYAEEALAYWGGRGLPAEKLVLGVPFYSRPSEVPYRKLVEADAAAAESDELDYFGTLNYYNGMPTMQQKTELALERGSGIMIWALSHDTADGSSLLSAIHDIVSSRQ